MADIVNYGGYSINWDDVQAKNKGTPEFRRAFTDWLNKFGADKWVMAQDQFNQGTQQFEEAFEKSVGRAPTEQESAKWIRDNVSGPNVGNIANPQILRDHTRSYIQDEFGELAEKEKAAGIDEKAQAEYGTIGEMFKSTLGRDATQAELDHFAKLKASGDADDYTIGQFLQALPENLQRQDTAARESLRGELTEADKNFFQRTIQPTVEASFLNRGRAVDPSNSALGAQFANAATEQNTAREQYLAGIGHEDYANRRALSINNYLGAQARQYQQQDYGQARADQLQDIYRGRSYELQNYDIQKRAYDEYLRNQGRRKSGGLGQLIGTGIGTAGGAYFGGPMGAAAGSQIGGSLGSYFDY